MSTDDRPQPPSFALAYLDSARQAVWAEGFRHVGCFADGKSRAYRVRYDFWVSPESDLLAVAGAGTVLGIPVQAVVVYTPLTDGRVVVSTDQQTAMEAAPDDTWLWALRPGFSFEDLIDWHRSRVAVESVGIVPFDGGPDDVLDRLATLRADRVAHFVDRGLARYRDPEQQSWSYTATGAVRVATRLYVKGMFDAIAAPFRRRPRADPKS